MKPSMINVLMYMYILILFLYSGLLIYFLIRLVLKQVSDVCQSKPSETRESIETELLCMSTEMSSERDTKKYMVVMLSKHVNVTESRISMMLTTFQVFLTLSDGLETTQRHLSEV